MSRKQPLRIQIGSHYVVEPEEIFESKVVKSGNGAVIKSFKRYLGRSVLVIVPEKSVRKTKESRLEAMEDLLGSASEQGWARGEERVK